MRSIVLVGGGVRSGKSAFALRRARALGDRRVFVATAEALDGEMKERIRRHAAERGGDFRTVEAPVALVEALGEIEAQVVVVDCLTIWISNLLVRGDSATRVIGEVDRLATILARRDFHAILVTNEVGMGIVPDNALARTFRDVVGAMHQKLAHEADEVYFAALGTLLRLHPGPVAIERNGGIG